MTVLRHLHLYLRCTFKWEMHSLKCSHLFFDPIPTCIQLELSRVSLFEYTIVYTKGVFVFFWFLHVLLFLIPILLSVTMVFVINRHREVARYQITHIWYPIFNNRNKSQSNDYCGSLPIICSSTSRPLRQCVKPHISV